MDRQVIGWRLMYDKTRRSDGKRKSVTEVSISEATKIWQFYHEHKMNAIATVASGPPDSIAVADTSQIVSIYRARE